MGKDERVQTKINVNIFTEILGKCFFEMSKSNFLMHDDHPFHDGALNVLR